MCWYSGLLLLVSATGVMALPLKLDRFDTTTFQATTADGQITPVRSIHVMNDQQIMVVTPQRVLLWEPSSRTAGPVSLKLPNDVKQVIPQSNRIGLLSQDALQWTTLEKLLDGKAPDKRVPLPDHQLLLTASVNSRLIHWKPNRLPQLQTSESGDWFPLQVGDEKITNLTMSANGRLFAVGFASGVVRIANLLPDGELQLKSAKRFPRRDKILLEFSPSGRLLAIGVGGRLVLVDVHTGVVYRAFERRFDDLDNERIVFSPDERCIAVNSMHPNPAIRVWHVVTGDVIAEYSPHQMKMTALAFNATATELYSGDESGLIKRQTLRLTATAKPRPLTDAWADLDSLLKLDAYQASQELIDDPKSAQVLAHVLTHLDDERQVLKKRIQQLDNDEYRIRELAHREITKTGYRGLEMLLDPKRGKLGSEGEDRILKIIDELNRKGIQRPENDMYGDQLRIIRALQILEIKHPTVAKTMCVELSRLFPATLIEKECRAISEAFPRQK